MSSIWFRRFPGLLLTLGIALLAFQIHKLPFAPFTIDSPKPHPIDTILIAIFLSMLIRNVFKMPLWGREGIQYASKGLLPLGIIFLGAKLDFFQIVRVSAQSLVISSICVVIALGLTYWLCIKVNVKRKLGFLLGVGTAICGGTAIVVMAPVIEADENDTALSVAVVTLFGMLAIFVFPLLGEILEMSQTNFGTWAGIAVHATPQVIAAGFAYGDEAGEISTIVKLVRVLMLAPLAIIATIFYARYQRAHSQVYVNKPLNWKTVVPPFIIGFLLMACANTFYFLPEMTLHLQENLFWSTGEYRLKPQELFTTVASLLITVSMAGIGFGLDLKKVLNTGLTPLYIGLFSAVVLSIFSYGLIHVFL